MNELKLFLPIDLLSCADKRENEYVWRRKDLLRVADAAAKAGLASCGGQVQFSSADGTYEINGAALILRKEERTRPGINMSSVHGKKLASCGRSFSILKTQLKKEEKSSRSLKKRNPGRSFRGMRCGLSCILCRCLRMILKVSSETVALQKKRF